MAGLGRNESMVRDGAEAYLESAHQPVLLERQPMLCAVGGAVAAEDAGHLRGGPVHRG